MVAEQALERRRSKVEIYLHFVWTTKYRAEVLTGELERAVHRCIVIKAQEMDCPVLAIGGTGDHVHLLLRLPTNRNVMDVVHRAKGASGRLFNSLRPPDSEPLYWQDGYGCFSLWYTQRDKAIAYIRDQKQHHREETLIDVFEQFDQPAPNTETTYEHTSFAD